jgi:hypothetical protein
MFAQSYECEIFWHSRNDSDVAAHHYYLHHHTSSLCLYQLLLPTRTVQSTQHQHHTHTSASPSGVISCTLNPDQLANMLPTSTAHPHPHPQLQASTRRRYSTCVRCSSNSPPSSPPNSLKARLCHLTLSHSAATSQKHCFCPAATPPLTRSMSTKPKTHQIPTPPSSLRASLLSRPDSTMNRTSWRSSMSSTATQTRSSTFTQESEWVTRSSRRGVAASTTRRPTEAMLDDRESLEQRPGHACQSSAEKGKG